MLIYAVALYLTSTPALAEENIGGVVRVLGSKVSTQVVLTEPNKYTGPKLCHNQVRSQISKLPGMTVQADGRWKLRRNGQKKCFVADGFTITKATSGRTPLVGTLIRSVDGFAIQTLPKKTTKISRVSPGLQQLVGQKVVVDVEPDPEAKSPVFHVVTWAKFPQ